jgi:hypothetical protein
VLVERHGKLIAEIYREGADRSIYSLFTRRRFRCEHATRHALGQQKFRRPARRNRHRRGRNQSLRACSRLFPELADLRNPERNAINVEHLLTMSSGLHWEETLATYGGFANDETHLYWAWNPDRLVLSRALDVPPGTRFNYSGGNTAVLADIIERTTKTSLRDYARNKIFEPLGIKDWEWIGDLWWRPIAFAGLRLRLRDLAKVGHMLLDKGQWQGREIVPAEWCANRSRRTSPRAKVCPTAITSGPAVWSAAKASSIGPLRSAMAASGCFSCRNSISRLS